MKYVVMSMRMMLTIDIKIRELRSICHANLEWVWNYVCFLSLKTQSNNLNL